MSIKTRYECFMSEVRHRAKRTRTKRMRVSVDNIYSIKMWAIDAQSSKLLRECDAVDPMRGG